MEDIFQIGDRVISTTNAPDGNQHITIGAAGTICQTYTRDGIVLFYGVRWDDNVNGHTCCGVCEDGYGWDMFAEQIEPMKDDLPEGIVPLNRGELKSLLLK